MSREERPARIPRIPRIAAEAGEHPASHGQRALWFLHRLAPESGAYNIAAAAQLPPEADRAALRRSFQALVDRHPALRTTLAAPGGEPRQRVHERMDLDWRVEDAADRDEEALAVRLSTEAFRPFDLEAGPLLRVRLYPGAAGGDALLLVLHHAIADLWSLAVLVRELGDLYAAETGGDAEPLPVPAVRYSDFVRWQEERLRGAEGERLWSFWRERLAGSLPVLDLATDRPRPPLQTWRGLARALRLGAGETAALQAHARERGATLFVLLLAAFDVLLHRRTGQEDLLVGAPAAGRRGRELAGVVGYFVNPVPLRADLAGDPAWNGLMERLGASVPADLAHQGYPFPLLAERLVPERDPARSPVFQAMLVLERAPARGADVAAFALGEGGARLDLGGLPVISLPLRDRRVLVDVTLAASEAGDGLALSLQLNADLFSAATAGRMLGHLRTLLAGALAEPGRRISELPLLSAEERSELLVERNRTASPWPADLLLHEPFEAQAARAPGAVALIWGEERLTYGELDRRANRIAHRLRGLGVGPEVRVGVHLRRSPALVAALFGVLKAGGAYVPLDPAYPEERLEHVCRDAGIALALVQSGDGDRLPQDLTRLDLARLDLARLDLAAPEALAGTGEAAPERLAGPGNLAYVLYTSGSTGRPKGCAVEHRSPVALVCWAREMFPPEELAGVLAATSIGFDLSVFELFVPLSAGGCAVLAGDLLALPSLPAREEVRLINTVPSVLAELERVWGLPAGVRTVNLAGEPLRRDLVDRLERRGIERVFNLYGPTEDTTYSTWSLVARQDPGPPAIGRPLANRRAYVLDRRLQPVPDGVPGQLFLGGAGLARGYLGRPELTAERFVPDAWSGGSGSRLYATGDLVRWRPGGELELLGRIDHQVKIRGFRIETGEIEAVLAACPGVLEAAVVVREGPGGAADRRLAAYVTAPPGAEPPDADLRRHLRRHLPDFMIPASFARLPALPRTASGKIDRRALPALAGDGQETEAPRNRTEEVLAAIWAELLDRPRIGIHDSFFDLGGHSLLAARLVARVRDALGVELPLTAVLVSPTVAGLAEQLAAGAPAGPASPIQPAGRTGPLPLSYGQRQIWLADRMQPGTALYNMPAAVALAGPLDRTALAGALAGLVRRHEALRTVFTAGDGEPLQEAAAATIEPPPLPLADLAALPAAAREEEAARRAEEEARRPFDLGDLGGRLLLRALLLRLGEAEHRLVLTLHHIAADGWSLGVLARELPVLYAGSPEELPPPAVQHGDYAAWQRRWLTPERLAPRLAAACERLADVPALALGGWPASARSPRGATVEAAVPAAAARALARRESATLPMLLLAAFAALLARATGARRFAVGVPLANRGRSEVEGLIGNLVNPVAVRIDVPESGGFRTLLAAVRPAALAAWAEEEVPFELVVRELGAAREEGARPVFQVMHVHQDPPALPELPGLAVRRLPLRTATAKLDLTLATAESGGDLQLELEHALDAVPADAASRLLGELRVLLAESLADPDRPLADLPLLPEAGRRQMVLEPAEDATPPRTHVEAVLSGLWAGLLGLPRVGVHADLFALGAHSLLATQVVSRLREALGVELPLGRVLAGRTVARLAGLVEEVRRAAPAAHLPAMAPIPRVPHGAELPLSFAQERLWFLDRLEPGSPAYNMPGAMLLRGALDREALRAALAAVAGRHAVLRTAFGESGGGRPAVQVLDRVEVELPVIDLSALPAPERDAEERRQAEREARAPFRLDAAPLLRARLLRLGRDEHLLLLTLHHIVCDGWSLAVLTREIAALYTAVRHGAAPPLPPLPIQFADFAAWQRAWLTAEVLADLTAGWREHLAGAPASLELPADRPRPEQASPRGAGRTFALPADLARRLAGLGREREATPFMVLFAGFQVLLHRLSGQDDLVAGTPVAGRTRRETEDLVGLFINLLPVRARLAPGQPFTAALAGARAALLAAYGRQDLPFEKLVEALAPERALGRSPLFQVLFVLQNAPAPPLELPGLELVPREAERPAAKLDLTLELRPDGDGLAGIAEYDPALWDATAVLRLLGSYAALLAAAAADPERPLADLPLFGEAERHQLCAEWNDAAWSWGREGELCLHELIAGQAGRTPDAVAVEMDGGGSWTCGELLRHASALAAQLRALGAGPEVAVAVLAERSLELMAGLLAILQAGAAYLPLDPAHPDERLERMVEEAGSPLLLLGEGLPGIRTAARVVPLTPSTLLAGPPAAPLPAARPAHPDNLAYVIYTSGSTGRPKGAMNAHRGVVNRLLWAREDHALRAGDRVLQKTPLGFDVSVWELFLPLLAGARLVLARPGGQRDPDYLAGLIVRKQVTIAHFVPSLLHVFLEAPDAARCAAALRRVVASGETLPPGLAGRFGERLPGVELHNLYGPTEAAVDVTAWRWTPGEERPAVPIGRPVANVRIHLFDAGMRPVPAGVAGELAIGGVQLARGYLGRPDLTAERFVPDPLAAAPGERLYRTGDLARHRGDGAIELLGRIDHQVKIRGVRIELPEIEAALGRLPGVAEAAVVVREDRPGDHRLVAYVVPAGGPGRMPAAAELREGLARSLPAAMVPAACVELPALPRLASGKLDRRALATGAPPPLQAGAADVRTAPRSAVEEILAGIWSKALGAGQIGAGDDFFALGGHSLLAVQVIAAVRSSLGVEVPLRRLFEAPTVAAFAREVLAAAPALGPAAGPIPRRPAGGPAPLSFGQRRLWFLDRWQPGSPAYNLHVALDLAGSLDAAALARSLAEVVRRHEVLRARFPAAEDQPVQVVDAALPGLPVIDLAGLPGAEAQAAELATGEGRRPFDLVRGPVLRALLLRLAARRHVLLLTVHHIAADGWSFGVLVREMGALYPAFAGGLPAPLSEPRIQYADFAAWQRERLQGEILHRLLAFWQAQLADAPAALELPADRPRPAVRRARGATLQFSLGREPASRLQRLARERGATLFMALLAGFGGLLHRMGGDSGGSRVVIGAPVAGRTHPDTEELVGFFVNSLALVLPAGGDPPFTELLDRSRETALATFAHQELPFERLVEELRAERDPSRTPVFQVMLALQNVPVPPLELPGLTLAPRPVDSGTSKLDLLLALTEGADGLAGELTYDSDLFDRTTAERLLDRLGRLLAAAASDPEVRLAALPFLAEAERHQLARKGEGEGAPAAPPAVRSGRRTDRAPRTPVEEVLAAIWSDVLGTGPVGRSESFFVLGGHSLLAIQAVSRIRTSFGIELPLHELFEAPAPEALAPRIEAALRTAAAPAAPPLRAGVREAAAPLSFAQERLWFLDRLAPGSAAYHIPAAVRLTGPLDPARLAAALGGVAARHEALRSRFVEIDGRPVQVVDPARGIALPLVDLGALPAALREAEAGRWTAAEVLRPFDLARGPLLRTLLLRLDEREHTAVLTLHHIAADGWSRTVLLRDLATLYRGEPLPPLPVQYADFAVWQRQWLAGDAREAQLAWWRERLAGLPPHLDLPADRPRPAVLGSRGAAVPAALPGGLADGLAALARRQGASLFMGVLAGFEALLGRIAGREDVAVGVPLANRTRTEIEELIGFFVNPVVLRLDLAKDPTFRELLAQTREATLGAYARQDLPFELLVEALAPPRDLGHTPLFQAALAFQNTPRGALDLPGLAVAPLPAATGTAKLDLTLILEEDLTGVLEYRTDLYDAPTVHRLLGHLGVLLAAAVADPERRVADLPLLSVPERAQILGEWNDAAAPYPREASLYGLFVEQAAATPDAVALVEGIQGTRDTAFWTYAGLRERAEALARHLDLEPEARVALLLDRSPLAIAAILAVLASGGAYVPLDPEFPRERLAVLLADSHAAVVLTETRHLSTVPETSAAVLCIDDLDASPPCRGEAGPLPGGDALAYVMYTSGSTGVPKGVAVPHRGVVRLVRSTGYAAFGPQETILQLAPLAFDASTFEIWGALLHGGRLVLAPPGPPSPDGVAAALVDQGVTTLWLTAGLFHVLAELPAARAAFGRLRQLLAGGDVLSPPHVAAALTAMPGGTLINGYGPTEGTTFSCCQPLRAAPPPRPDLPVPIGRPIANTAIYLLDRCMEPVPAGVPGELYVGGDGLARGYHGRPDLTAERFVPNPFCDPPGSRLYRTGDLARLLPDGRLGFLGRTDHQVKIRGFRVEPGEIEAALLRHPDITGAAVVPAPDAAGELRLAAFYTAADPSAPPSTREVRERLQESLPAHLVPSAFFLRPDLPLTANGKVDRASLAREASAAVPAASAAAGEPRTPVEELLAGIWAEVLGIERAGLHDDFFELGGHSLLAARAVARMRQSLGVEVPLRALFEAPSPAGLAPEVERALRGGGEAALPPLSPITPVLRGPALVPSFAQERLWFLDRLAPGGSSYNVPWALRLRGRLDPSHLAAALGALAARHEALRTAFGEADGRPVLEIAPAGEVALPVADLAGLPVPRRETEMRRLADEEGRRPFDLSRLLLRATLVRQAGGEDAEHVLLLTLHHAVCDGGSIPILLRELLALLQAAAGGRPAELPALPVQYVDYAAWQRSWLAGGLLESELAWWRQTLEGAPPLLDLPLDRPRPRVRRPRGAACALELSGDLARALAALGRQRGATLFMTLLAALDVLLSRHSGQEDLCAGFPVAGRNRIELESLAGLFVNTLVARADLTGDPPFAGLLARVRERVLGAYAHQDVPFERLVEELAPRRDLSLTPLFQVLFVDQSQPGLAELSGRIELPGLTVEPLGRGGFGALEGGTAKLDLTFAVAARGPGLAVTLDYDAALFDRPTVLRLLSHWQTLLAGIVAAPEAPLSDLPLLTGPERAQILEEWSGAAAGVEPAACLHRLLEDQADRTPGAVALVAGDRTLTYAELDAAANRIAHRLLRQGAGPEVPVAVCLGRTADLVVALLAVLKAGAAYVPLDPRYPPARLELLLADARAAVLVTERRWLESLPAPAARLLCLDGEETGAESARRPEVPVRPGHLAYIIYTSGSTGRPKGVGIEHRSAAALVTWARRDFPPATLAAVLAATSICFDLSIFEIFAPLAAGGRIVLAEHALAPEPGVTLVNTVPSAMAELVRGGGVPATAATLNLAGEPLPRSLADALFELEPAREVRNLYGPTETTTYSTMARMVRGDGRAPAIGRPVAGDRVYLVDRHLRPVPAGVTGEILIGGAGLARGYMGRPDWTALRFVPDPFGTEGSRLYRTGDLARWRADGELELAGRIDDQVKLRGFRIEPGEVEAALRAHPEVEDAAVVVRDGRLAAYAAPGAVVLADLRSFLAERLPAYLLPSTFVVLEALPRTANGKLDRGALPVPDGRSLAASPAPPSGPTEEALACIWAELLGVERVGAHDSFFDLGGHSLLGAQLLARVRSELGVQLPLQTLFEGPTVAALALEVERARCGTAAPAFAEIIPRVSDDRDAEELLSQLDGLSDDEVATLLRELSGS